MNAIDLLKRIEADPAANHLASDLRLDLLMYLDRSPNVVNVMLHGTQVISVLGPFNPVEADQYAKIATSVGGVRVTTIRMDYPSKKKS